MSDIGIIDILSYLFHVILLRLVSHSSLILCHVALALPAHSFDIARTCSHGISFFKTYTTLIACCLLSQFPALRVFLNLLILWVRLFMRARSSSVTHAVLTPLHVTHSKGAWQLTRSEKILLKISKAELTPVLLNTGCHLALWVLQRKATSLNLRYVLVQTNSISFDLTFFLVQ